MLRAVTSTIKQYNMEVVLSLIAQREVEVMLAGVVTRFVLVARGMREGEHEDETLFKVESE